MSFQAMTWAVEQKVPTYQKIVLIMLANRTNHDTGLCFPSLSMIADECGMTRRSVIEQIAKLEKAGLLSVIRHKREDNVNWVNNYRLHLEVRSHVKSARVVNQVHQGSEPHSLGVVNQVHPNQEYINQEINQEDFNQEINREVFINNPVKSESFKRSCENEIGLVDAVLPWYRQQGYSEDIDKHFRHFMKRIPALQTPPRNAAALFRKAIVDDWAGLRAPKVTVPVVPDWAVLPDKDCLLFDFVCKHLYPKSLGMLSEKDLRKRLKVEISERMEMFLDYGNDVYPDKRRTRPAVAA